MELADAGVPVTEMVAHWASHRATTARKRRARPKVALHGIVISRERSSLLVV
jgi:hypothetical protein